MNIQSETTISDVDWVNVSYWAKEEELSFYGNTNTLRVAKVDAQNIIQMFRNEICCIEANRITSRDLHPSSVDQLREIAETLNAYFKAKKSTKKEA